MTLRTFLASILALLCAPFMRRKPKTHLTVGVDCAADGNVSTTCVVQLQTDGTFRVERILSVEEFKCQWNRNVEEYEKQREEIYRNPFA